MKLMMGKYAGTAAFLAAGMLFSTTGYAQDVGVNAEGEAAIDPDGEIEDDEAEPEPEPEPERVEERSTMEVDEPQTEVETERDDGESDHDQVVGRFGVGYLGRQSMVVGADQTTVYAPVIGVRYWLMDFMGIDAGIGLNVSGGRTTVTDTDDVKKPGLGVYIVHVGVPLNLYDRGSFSFQLVPEMNMGLAFTGDQNAADDIKVKDRGFHYSVGARAGAELHFGFMGIPELSLQGNVGLYLQTDRGATVTKADGMDDVKATDGDVSFGTTLGADPWDIFAGSISALYYF